MNTSFPVVKLTLEGMQHAIMMAFNDHVLKMDDDVQNAVKEYCTPKNVNAIIAAEVKRRVDESIASRIESYFKYGEGSKLIDEIVKKSMPKVTK